jgi:hypothetical protein
MFFAIFVYLIHGIQNALATSEYALSAFCLPKKTKGGARVATAKGRAFSSRG